MDNWIASRLGAALRAAPDPLVVDLGYGATPVTAVELLSRLRAVRADVRVLGLELDPSRVGAAAPATRAPALTFEVGGFELAGRRPAIVRAANVLRQYSPADAAGAWSTLCAGLADGGALVEGTCDEIGRLAAWVLLDADGPRSLTLACRVESLGRPGDLAARLPKALIHHNVPGQPIHALLRDFDAAWAAAASVSVFGPRQRWGAACAALATSGWPVDVSRARYGELGIGWAAVAPV